MSTETVPVPVELLEAWRLRMEGYEHRQDVVADLMAWCDENLTPHPRVVEAVALAIAERISSDGWNRHAIGSMRDLARAALSAVVDLGWTPPEET